MGHGLDIGSDEWKAVVEYGTRNIVESLICQDDILATLDKKLAGIYAAAVKKDNDTHLADLKADQRGWIKGRNACWKSEKKRLCVEQAYIYRSAALQAQYQLVPDNDTFNFICDDEQFNEVIVTFYQTTPLTIIASRGDNKSLMYIQAIGSIYQGRNEMFWEHQGEALITWGYESPEMICKRASNKNNYLLCIGAFSNKEAPFLYCCLTSVSALYNSGIC